MNIGNIVFGIVVLFVAAAAAWAIGVVVPWLDPLLVAVAIGALLSNTVGVPAQLQAGVNTHKLWLATGIVLLGASVSIQALIAGGIFVFALVVSVVVVAAVLVEGVAKNVFGVRERLGSLLAAGTGICGVSAIVAVAGSIDADEETIAYAAGTVLLFDAITLVVYPTIGSLLSIPGQVFGVWAGLSMFSTGPVVAAGFAHSELAGQWATITKLARNALIGLVVLGYAAYYTRRGTDTRVGHGTLWAEFPKFVLGFVALAAIASAGLLSDGQITRIETIYNWLFLIAFVGLGTELQRSILQDAGLKPVAIVFFTWFAIAAVTLPGSWILFG